MSSLSSPQAQNPAVPPPSQAVPVPSAPAIKSESPSIPAVKSDSPSTPAVNSETPSIPAVNSETPSTPAVNSETPPPATLTTRLPETSTPPVSYTITVPGCSAWFSWDGIHETERKNLPEFFDGKFASRNSTVYQYYRNSIIKRFRGNPSRKITFTEARRGLVGDVGSIRRVFDFLEAWGLINYASSAKSSSKEKREVVEASEKESPKKLCSNCKSILSLACFTTDKSDIVLCARCYVRGNYRPGLSTSDFKRVDITEETSTDWTDKETLHLLEAVLHYGEDWKKVAAHVGTRTEKDCVARFIKLPFGEQFTGSFEDSENGTPHHKNEQDNVKSGGENVAEQNMLTQRHLTPLADASNPIMAQVAFLSAMVGSEVAGTTAQAAIAALEDVNPASMSSINGVDIGFSDTDKQKGEAYVTNDLITPQVLKDAATEAESQLRKEQHDVEQFLTNIMESQMKEIQGKIAHFEEMEMQAEKEWLQLRHMKDLFFVDQLVLLQHKTQQVSPESGEREIKTNHDVT